MVDFTKFASKKHSENLYSEALKASDTSQQFSNLDKVLGLKTFENSQQAKSFERELIGNITTNAVENSTTYIPPQERNIHDYLAYQSSNLESLHEMMMVHIQNQHQLMQKIKHHPKSEKIFEQIDQLCNEHNVTNVVELMSQKYEIPEVNHTIAELNEVINNEPELKKDFQQFQNEYVEFINTQKQYESDVRQQIDNPKLDDGYKTDLVHDYKESIGEIHQQLDDVLSKGRSVPVYNAAQENASPMIYDQHNDLKQQTNDQYETMMSQVQTRKALKDKDNELTM